MVTTRNMAVTAPATTSLVPPPTAYAGRDASVSQ